MEGGGTPQARRREFFELLSNLKSVSYSLLLRKGLYGKRTPCAGFCRFPFRGFAVRSVTLSPGSGRPIRSGDASSWRATRAAVLSALKFA